MDRSGIGRSDSLGDESSEYSESGERGLLNPGGEPGDRGRLKPGGDHARFGSFTGLPDAENLTLFVGLDLTGLGLLTLVEANVC